MAAYIRTISFSVFCICVAFFLPGSSLAVNSAQAAQHLEITNITPSGEDVPAVKKIVFQFNRPVVPVGAMDRKASEIPITIKPELEGRWRWLNTSALAYILDEKSALKPATRYEIIARPGIKAEDGATLDEQISHSFITQRPSVVHSWFMTWRSPTVPVVRMTFNQPVSRSSVEKHLFLKVLGKDKSRIGIRAETDEQDKVTPVFLPLPGEKLALVTLPRKDNSEQEEENRIEKYGREARRIWLVSPERELPGDIKVSLRIEPGIESVSGPEEGAESRELLVFNTFPEFYFEGIACYDNYYNSIFIKPGEVHDDRKLCNPTNRVNLVFSSPVLTSEIKQNIKLDPPLEGEGTENDPWKYMGDYTSLNRPYLKDRKYHASLPMTFDADQNYTVDINTKLRDEFGRSLKTSSSISFKTNHMPPDYRLTNPVSILEKNVDTDMPVVVTNLDKFSMSFSRLTTNRKDSFLYRELSLPKTRNLPMKIPMGIRDMLEGKSGVVTGTVHSQPSTRRYRYDEYFFAEVTPFQVHVKLGHFNTLAWVTDLQTGNPVEWARVSIFRGDKRSLTPSSEILTEGITNSNGLVSLAGSEKLDPDMNYTRGYRRDSIILYAKVEKGDDLALLPMDYNFLMNTYQASNHTIFSSNSIKYGHIRSWGTTAQGVYRAGDNIQYKIYVRNQDSKKLVPAPAEKYDLKVIDPMNKTVHEVNDIVLSDFGSIHGEFQVPKTGAVGWYRFILSASFTRLQWQPMRVLVSDFTASPFKVTTDINGKIFQPGDKIDITTQARLHGGGPYTDASARITVALQKRPFTSGNPLARGFLFNSFTPDTIGAATLLQKDGKVDDKGNLATSSDLPETEIYYGRLEIESAVRDDRGKYITGRAFADYSSRDRFVGLRSDSWIFKEGEPSAVDVIVVDTQGAPEKGVPVSITLEHRETTAARVKGAGNAYLTRMNTVWVEEKKQTITSGKEAVEFCFNPEKSGLYRITALIEDSRGRKHSTELTKWVTGSGMVLWEDDNKNGLDIVPEKTEYKVGETARYLVKNPFPGTQALVTIERYGVIKHWIETLETATPVIEFKIEKDFTPGYFLSVVVMSPRIEKPPGNNDVDLGKPAFRMGYVQSTVSDPYKKIRVDVAPEKNTYKPGDKVKVNLHAILDNDPGEKPVELAVAVLDEAVLDLIRGGSDYFDPYKGFYKIDGLDMLNYSLLMRLVGRQKFEKKGADPAGDGGGDIGLRNIFKFLSYWNPSIKADSNGRADIEFEVPDNLTGWRVLAMAVTPGDRMGLGEGRFNVNRPTEIRPVMPNQVMEGDNFTAGFSVMNRTDKTRELIITITASGAIETEDGSTLISKSGTINAEPYKRVTLWLPVKSKGSGKIKFTARGGDSTDKDGTVYELDVRKMSSLETSATYGTSEENNITESIKFPEEIRTDVGKVFINLSPTVIGNLEGAFEYLRDYSYSCWEQKITRAVMASHYTALKKYLPVDFIWEDAAEIPDSMLNLSSMYQAPCGGMVYYIPDDRYVSPYLSAYTALAFNWLKTRGYNVPVTVESRLHGYLETMLRKDVTPSFYSRGMASTVRAVALAALAQNNKITIDDLRRYYPFVKEMDTFGKAHFLVAASLVNGAAYMGRDVFKMIVSQADQTGGKFIVNDIFDDGYSRILTSPIRTNAAVLSAILAYGNTDQGKYLTRDIPFKIARYITQTRKQAGRWENTQENVFCANALVEYSSIYENQNPDMLITAVIGKDILGRAEFKNMTDDPVLLKRPIEKDDPGMHTQASIKKEGTGRFYYSVGMSYAPEQLRTYDINAGIEVKREYSVERDGKWVLLKSPMTIKRGELVRVDLYVSIPAARNFVVVDDPVPGGLEPVNRDLATASSFDADKAKSDYAADSWFFHYGEWSWYGMSRWCFYHRELRHHAARFYSEWLPPGNYHLSYTAQAIVSGEFTVMATHAEEMYDPDVFGKSAPAVLDVEMGD